MTRAKGPVRASASKFFPQNERNPVKGLSSTAEADRKALERPLKRQLFIIAGKIASIHSPDLHGSQESLNYF